MKHIELGAISIIDWEPTDKLYPAWYDEEAEKGDADCKKWAEGYQKLDPKEVVLAPDKEFILKITYPLTIPCEVKMKTGKKGITRLALVKKVITTYRKIYEVEDSTTNEKPGYIPGMCNRNRTDGKFGIWGHDIGDLMLCSAHLDSKKNIITLGVDS